MNLDKKYLIRRSIIVAFVAIISIIIYLSISSLTGSLINRDNYSPELNPIINLQRYLLSPAWRGYRGLGFGGESESADIFRSGLNSFIGIFANTQNLGVLYYLLTLIFGGVFTGLITKYIISNSKYADYSHYAFIFSFVFYITSLWTIWLNYQTIAPFTSLLLTFPLSVFALVKYFDNKDVKSLLLVFLSSIFSLASAVISTQALIAIPIIILVSLILSNRDLKLRIGTILKGISVYLSVQLIWLIPLMFYVFGSTEGLVESQTNKSITSTVIDLERGAQTLSNSLNFYTRILTEKETDGFVFPYSQDYFSMEINRVLSFVPISFALLAFLLAIFRRNWRLIYFGVLAIIVIFIIKVDNPPMGGVFNWLQENIPLFKQVLRWPISKLGTVLLFFVSLLASVGVVYFIDLISSFTKGSIKKLLPILIVTIVLIGQFTFAKFLFNGSVIDAKSVHNIPASYYKLEEYLHENDASGRIYYMPPANNNYFRKYNWGFYGSQFLSYIVPNPIIDSANAIGSEENELAISEFTSAIRDYDLSKFIKTLNRYKVRYVLFDESVSRDGFVFSTNINKERELLNKLDVVFKSDSLTLYEVKGYSQSDFEYIEMIGSDSDINYLTRENNKNPLLKPLSVLGNDVKKNKNFLVGNNQYNGVNTDVNLVIENKDIQNLPAFFISEKDILRVYPAVPTLGEPFFEGNIPYKEFKLSNQFNYIKVEDVILNRTTILDGITIDTKYSDIESIMLLKSKVNEIDLTSQLFNLPGSDCSGSFTERTGTLRKESSALGVELGSENGEPCVYLPIYQTNEFFEISVDWESTNSTPSICIYSKKDDKCLNELRYVRREGKTFGRITIRPEYLNSNDNLTLILSVIDSNNPKSAFRNLKIVEYVNSLTIKVSKEVAGDYSLNYSLKNGEEYNIFVPIVLGKKSFIYNPSENLSWYFNRSESSKFQFDRGDLITTTKSSFDVSNYLYNLSSGSDNLIFASADNIENIPLTLCLTSNIDSRCVYQRIFDSGLNSTFTGILSRNNKDERLNAIINSLSYTNTSVNKLNSFMLFELPQVWGEIKYTPQSVTKYVNTQLQPIGDSNYSTYYYWENANNLELVSINQAVDKWWVALGSENGIWKLISNDMKVTLNGWEQGWDLSDSNYNEVFVLYLPNIITYIVYALNIVLFISLSLLTLKEVNPWKKKVRIQ